MTSNGSIPGSRRGMASRSTASRPGPLGGLRRGTRDATGTEVLEALDEPAIDQLGAHTSMRRLLIEVSLELIDRGLIEGLQDLGAGGITCATSETADRAGTGIQWISTPSRGASPTWSRSRS